HLVLSTFHTNDAPSAISRMVYMGVEPYLLASTVNLIIAQRLVRRICERCKEPVQMSEEQLERMKISPERAKNAVLYHGAGCNACANTGYYGRLPIFEFLVIDGEIREELVSGAKESRIRELSRKKGYHGLFESGINRVLAGLTTAEEVLGATIIED
ncbi:MAG: Flp pilus assembly complex ATPase component TadA, partial [Sedimentisphaerales bacterium]|nr:Flp pilus assembly complex ATPase component TadA [Sedimentisphaerales bacterium]